MFSNWLAQLVALIKPRNLFLVIGRGGGKTNDFLTERLMDMVYDMPGAPGGSRVGYLHELAKEYIARDP